MIKKFLFSLVVVLTTFLFATSANAREIASITRTPVMEIPAITANPTSTHFDTPSSTILN